MQATADGMMLRNLDVALSFTDFFVKTLDNVEVRDIRIRCYCHNQFSGAS